MGLKVGQARVDEPHVPEEAAIDENPVTAWSETLDQALGLLDADGWLRPCHGPWSEWAVPAQARVQFMDLVHPADRDACRGHLLIDGPEVRSFRVRTRRSDGDWAWSVWTVGRRCDGAARADGWTRVISGRVVDRGGCVPGCELARSDNDARSVMEHVPAMVWLADIEGRLTFGNRAMLAFVGSDEFYGGGWASICDAEHAEAVLDALREALTSGRATSLRCRLLDRESASRWCVMQVSPRLGDEGEVLGLVGTCTEVHDLPAAMLLHRARRGFASEREALQDLGLLAGGVAHDFNNLLTVIQGNLEICALDAREDQAPLLEAALQASSQAAGLCRKILLFAGKGSVVREHLDLNSVVLAACRPFQGRDWDGPVVQVRTSGQALAVEGDRHQLVQVIQNFVTNGLDAVRGTGRRLGFVRVRCGLTRIDGRAVAWVRCSDNGLGMDRATVLRMFEPYYSTKGSGRGLGLAAAQGIVKAHGGHITVHSEAGVGTTVQLELPIRVSVAAEADAPAVDGEEGADPAPASEDSVERDLGLAGRRVLVVDDEAGIRDLIAVELRASGCAVVAVDGGAAALEALAQGRFDIVLSDLSMPEVGGTEVLAAAAAVQPAAATVLMSGYAPDLADQSAADAFLQKPFVGDDLRAAIAAASAARC